MSTGQAAPWHWNNRLSLIRYILLFTGIICFLSMIKCKAFANENKSEIATCLPEIQETIENGYRIIVEGRLYQTCIGQKFYQVMNETNDYTLIVPANVDLDRIIMEHVGGGDVCYDGEQVEDLNNGTCKLKYSFSGDNLITSRIGLLDSVSVQCIENGISTMLTIHLKICSEKIASLYIDIDESKTTIEEMENDPLHNIRVSGYATIIGVEDLCDAQMTMKGRGNSSWTRRKKSYQISLKNKADVLGMGCAKKWILLSNTADASLLRNAIGFWLASELGMKFTSQFRYVDLFFNGEYRGIYLLCEKNEIGKTRIDITNIDKQAKESLNLTNGEYLSNEIIFYSPDHKMAFLTNGKTIDLTGGYHMEIDNYADELQLLTKRNQLRLTIKEPEIIASDIDDEAYTYIKDFCNSAEEVLYNESTTKEELSSYFNIESFALLWLHTEYLRQMDAAYTFHMWKESEIDGDGLLHAGPVWDMDRSMNRNLVDLKNTDTMLQPLITGNQEDSQLPVYQWLDQLLHFDFFKEEIIRQYELHKELFSSCEDCNCEQIETAINIVNNNCNCTCYSYAQSQYMLFSDSVDLDLTRWDGTNVYRVGTTREAHDASVAMVYKFLCVRAKYLSDRISAFKEDVKQAKMNADSEALFSDVSKDLYYYDAVQHAAQRGIVIGKGNHCFIPNEPCSRAQAIAYLWMAAGFPDSDADNPFSDVQEFAYYNKAVRWAFSEGIIIDTDSDSSMLGPNENITLMEGITILWRIAKAKSLENIDEEDFNSDYMDILQWAIETGVLPDTNKFTMSEYCSCGDFIYMIYNCGYFEFNHKFLNNSLPQMEIE